MSKVRKAVISDGVTRRNLIMFPIGTVGRDMMYNLFGGYLYTFVLFTRRNLTSAQLTAITIIMLLARAFDALNDPLMGNIIERTRTRWGKFKPWLATGIVTTALVIYLAFNVTLQGWPFIAFFGAIYFCYSITFTMHDISYWGMIPSLSSDPDIRNRYTSRATLFSGIGMLLTSVLVPIFTTGDTALGGNAVTAYGYVALIVALLGIGFICFTLFGVRENRSFSGEPVPPVSGRKIISTVTGNDQLIWVSVAFLLQQLGNTVTLSGVGSTYIYMEFGYQGIYFTVFQFLGILMSGFLMIFYPMISRHTSRRKLMNILMIIGTAGYIVMLLSGLLIPVQSAKFFCLTFGYMLSNVGQYGFYLVMMISIVNTVEYNEYKHGTRDEGIIASIRPLVTKFASALTVIITTGSYMIFGVINYTNGISSLEQQANLGEITSEFKNDAIDALLDSVLPSQSNGLLLVMTVLPFALMLVSWWIYQKKYKLDETEYERICAVIESRKA